MQLRPMCSRHRATQVHYAQWRVQVRNYKLTCPVVQMPPPPMSGQTPDKDEHGSASRRPFLL
eukprot:4611893-Lingulodinium_polyedra.AAC.1